MRNRYSLPAWLRRTVGLLALVPVLALVPRAAAQAPGAAEPAKHYTRDQVFKLPIRIEERARSSIREVQLYMKTPGGEWQRRDSAPPTQQHFQYKTPHDGEYWFTLVTVDVRGQAVPTDLNRLAPEDVVMVIVDTQPPAF